MIPTQVTRGIVHKATGPVVLNNPGVADPSVEYSVSDAQEVLNGSSTPPVTLSAESRVTLTAGAATLDLTAIDQGNAPTVDLTGLKVQTITFKAADANTDRVDISVGATNGYEWGGIAASLMSLGPGESLTAHFNETLDDVAVADAEIDFASVDVDAVIDVMISAG